MRSYLNFLRKNAMYTAIEAAGLIISMAFVIIIGCYIAQQYNVRNENPDRERIFTFGSPDYLGETFAFNDEIRERLPEIEISAKYSGDLDGIVSVKGKKSKVKVCALEKTFFDIFPYYKFVSGSPEGLESKSSVVVSESFARAHGVDVGETLRLGNDNLTIVGVIEDFNRTIFKYTDLIVNPLNQINESSWSNPYDCWGSVIPFIKVRKGTDRAEFASKVKDICKEIYPSVYGTWLLTECKDYRLDELFFTQQVSSSFNCGDLNSLRMLTLIALLVLISALFNYVNLNIALTGKRAMEMAVRRLNGASESRIFLKHIAESVSFTGACIILSVIVAMWFAPTMNRLMNDPDIPITISYSPIYILFFILFAVVTGVISGMSPALIACRFRPIDIASGNFRRHSKMVFSKIFIIVQNTLAVLLIGLGGVMEVQYHKSLQRPMNADIGNKYFLMLWSSTPQTGLVTELAKLPCVKKIGRAQGVPGVRPGGQISETRYGEEILYRTCRMDSTAFAMLKIEKTRDLNAPLYNSVWFSETAWAETGYDDDYHDCTILSQRAAGCGQVAGTFKDFPINASNIGSEEPAIIPIVRTEEMRFGGWLLDIIGDENEARKEIRRVYEEWSEKTFGTYVTPSKDFFLQENFLEELRPAHNNMRLTEVFMVIAVLISLLGLVAMSTYYAGENAKTTAIRKVFGGTIESETIRNILRYMVLVLTGCVTGLPMAIWSGGKYLEDFIYKLDTWWWIPVIGAGITLVISFFAVLWQTLSSARINPVEVLKQNNSL